MKQMNMFRRHRYIFKKLISSNSKDRKIILKNAPSELFTVFKLIFKLIVDEKLNLTKAQNENLKRYSSFILTTSSLKGKQIKQKLLNSDRALISIIRNLLPTLF